MPGVPNHRCAGELDLDPRELTGAAILDNEVNFGSVPVSKIRQVNASVTPGHLLHHLGSDECVELRASRDAIRSRRECLLAKPAKISDKPGVDKRHLRPTLGPGRDAG
jgi:hypothetical protein